MLVLINDNGLVKFDDYSLRYSFNRNVYVNFISVNITIDYYVKVALEKERYQLF